MNRKIMEKCLQFAMDIRDLSDHPGSSRSINTAQIKMVWLDHFKHELQDERVYQDIRPALGRSDCAVFVVAHDIYHILLKKEAHSEMKH